MKEAKDDHYCIRRLPPWSSHWHIEEGRPKRSSYADKSGELSINIYDSLPPVEVIKKHNPEIEKRGFGYSISLVKPINDVLEKKEVLESESGKIGKTYHQPLEDEGNEWHGVITGKDTKKKSRALKEVFEVKLEPLPFD